MAGSGGRACRRIHERSLFGHRDLLGSCSYLQRQIDNGFLTHHQVDAPPHLLLETQFFSGHFIWTHRKRRHTVAAILCGSHRARQPALGMLDGNGHSRYYASRTVAHDT